MKYFIPFICVSVLFFFGCKPMSEELEIVVRPICLVDGNQLQTDSLCYVNAAGNAYQISDIQWFISNVEIKNENGDWVSLDGDDNVHYAENTNDKNRFAWNIKIPKCDYDSIRFTFGLNEIDNESGRYLNQPEANMFWPEMLGGGYHYMKLNGKWKNINGELQPFAVHLGIGQNAELTEFYDNSFDVDLLFATPINSSVNLDIVMNIEQWFVNPNVYDFNEWGGSIMQNQTAQQVLRENGATVFEVISYLIQ